MSAWHLGTAPCVAVAPSTAVSHPQPCVIPGGYQIQVSVAIFLGLTASSKGSPNAKVRFRRDNCLPSGRNHITGGGWRHGASLGQERSLPEEHAATAFLRGGGLS